MTAALKQSNNLLELGVKGAKRKVLRLRIAILATFCCLSILFCFFCN